MSGSVRRTTMPSIEIVAKEAGVSTATAGRALGGYGSVSRKSREAVLAAAERLGYRPNSLARSMITGLTHTLGVLVPDIENPFFSRALRGIADAAHERGWEVLLVNTDEDLALERKALSVLTERRVDGLVVAPTDVADRDALQAVVDAGIPVVLLDRRVPGLEADTVGIDNRAAAKDATERLLKLGHRSVALLTGGDEKLRPKLSRPGLRGVERLAATTVGARAAGYRDALVEAGIEPRPELVSAEGFRREDAAAATRRLLALPDPPTAILALDSLLALGVLQALRGLGLRCPVDVSLVAFDDADWAEAISPPLSVVAQPIYELGAEAGRLLLDRVQGSDKRFTHRRLPTRFIERESATSR
ncbi:LacI family DNA-binding transcriptional regulator [Nonomuraea rhodomycinica]|uniref:LacI family DNA-binding transcriptional regulator n=1 Tax=Nonomuraea rhodomycinica TaxID=1712872 RepID=A0A7Y6IVW5_9ACTN|nr:LacI family DNA-binding transcriptional regulator [Nonomuraea rhodomycinica]NUW44049.1 LacI family DNA-binding transcriptional regulator [Nonomuraea rhodomycinica]